MAETREVIDWRRVSHAGCAHGAPVTHLDQGGSRCAVSPLEDISYPENIQCQPLAKGSEPHRVRTGLAVLPSRWRTFLHRLARARHEFPAVDQPVGLGYLPGVGNTACT